MFKDNKNSIIIALMVVIAILIMLRQCEGDKLIIGNEPIHDTIIDIDTVPFPYKVIELKPIKFPVHDTITEIQYQIDSNTCKYERTYTDSFPDSNITIFSNIKTIGVLKLNELKYRLKVPQYIKKTIEIHDVKIVPNKWDLYVNGGVGGNKTQFNFMIGGGLRVKKAYYGYGYDIINKTHNTTVGIKLFSSKK